MRGQAEDEATWESTMEATTASGKILLTRGDSSELDLSLVEGAVATLGVAKVLVGPTPLKVMSESTSDPSLETGTWRRGKVMDHRDRG